MGEVYARTIGGRMDRNPTPTQFAGALVAGFLALANPGSSAANERIHCGSAYTVASGDTLTAIAARAYGNAELASAIFAANTEILRDANAISVGVQLLVPCLDRNLPHWLQAANPVAAKLSRPAGSIAPAIAPPPPQIDTQALRGVTVSDFPPFAGGLLTEGGLVTDLVRRAIGAADDNRDLMVGFVGDWNAHLEDLLPSGDYDVSFPWAKPDCDRPNDLSAATRQLCEGFIFSRPIVELIIAYFHRADGRAAPVAPGETLAGKRVCHASGAGFLDLENSFPKAVLETAPSSEACFDLLKAGKIDIVALPQHRAEAVIRGIGIAEPVSEIDGLRTGHTLHAVALMGSPAGETAIELIDRGLESLMMSGAWFDIVVMHQRHSTTHW